MDLGPSRVVLLGPVMHPRPAHLVGQPRPAALDGRFRRDRQRLLDGGLVADRRVELDDHRRGDTDNLPVGQLELTVDLLAGVDRSELGRHWDGLTVVADHRAAPGVGSAEAERFGGPENGAIAVERARNGLALRVCQRDALEPAVLHLNTHWRDGRDVGGSVSRQIGDRGRGRRGGGACGRFAALGTAGCQCARRDDADRKGGQCPPSTDRRQWIGGAHVDPGYLESGPNQNRFGCEVYPERRSNAVAHRPGQRDHVRCGGAAPIGHSQRMLGR